MILFIFTPPEPCNDSIAKISVLAIRKFATPLDRQGEFTTHMASLAFTAIFSSPLQSISATQTKSQLIQKPSWVSPAVSLSLSNKLSVFGSSNSGFSRNEVSLLLSRSDGFATVDRNSARKIYARAAAEKTIHDYTVKDIDGKDVSLSKFKGKILLIVNVASQCGLTSSNYKELSHLYEKYKTQGFEILAFPCNQFGGQEPGSNQDIKQFACTRFKAEFPIFDKVDVNGPNTAPIYQFMKSSTGGLFGDLVKWNFEKFLADKNGKVVQRYPPTTSPLQIEKDIQKLLAA